MATFTGVHVLGRKVMMCVRELPAKIQELQELLDLPANNQAPLGITRKYLDTTSYQQKSKHRQVCV